MLKTLKITNWHRPLLNLSRFTKLPFKFVRNSTTTSRLQMKWRTAMPS